MLFPPCTLVLHWATKLCCIVAYSFFFPFILTQLCAQLFDSVGRQHLFTTVTFIAAIIAEEKQVTNMIDAVYLLLQQEEEILANGQRCSAGRFALQAGSGFSHCAAGVIAL
ncbi:hypothetical protein XENOCAPTIV_019673 [Xenoophorus captivus]|uniref:Secreted protein n=1 Tax=Xenoophorus captivus TaxID=1517983 RepID=A0ABV0Q5I7_9TELE